MSTNNMRIASERITAGATAGNSYVSRLESIRDTLFNSDATALTDNNTSLGTMVAAQLEMTEVETRYMVESGIPKKASGTNQQASQEIKKAAG
jgi:hypothetical protein